MRSFQPRDRSAALELWNQSVGFDPLSSKLWDEKVTFDPGTSLVWDDGRVRAFAHGVRRGEIGYVKLLCVDPAWRRRGVASQLVRELEEQLGATRVRVAGSAPNYLQPGIDVRYTAGLLLFERLGYQRFGETLNLRCPLNQLPPLPLRTGVRRANEGDRGRLLEFIASHFPAWRAEVEACYRRDPVSCFVAVSGDQVVGFSAYDANNVGHGWFGPMGTAPEARGGGLGGVLLQHCLHAFRDQGLTSCVIPWVGPYGFYARQAGAWIERVFWRYEKVRALES